jgi:hypothetical protein
MDIAALKSFATAARTDLLKEVKARLGVVLAPGSNSRVEHSEAVDALEVAIQREGRDAVVDRVAYTWFNRMIALRFMDANGYTAAGVVSPESGKTVGQPQVLSDAKGGDFDSDVVSAKTQDAVTALLNGTRPSQDAQRDAYGLLLEAYCRYWNKSMPFMFEREGDYTELLMPTALLSTDSVRDRTVRTLTGDACSKVEVIGWLYQFYISERKDEVFAGFKNNKKAGAAEIPAATQLFTPHWIVRYLVENSLGRLWLLNRPESKIAAQMKYYIAPVDEETDFHKVLRPEELRVVDPAVGSGHMLTYAFDLLYAIYEEEGYAPSDIPGLILRHNLHGAEIDQRAGALAAFALTMKAAAKRRTFLKSPVQPNICVLEPIHFDASELDYLWSRTDGQSVARADAEEFWNAFENADIFGSLIRPNGALLHSMRSAVADVDDFLHGSTLESAKRVISQADFLVSTYSVVVANPPYMGSGSMGELLSKWVARNFPSVKQDLYGCFVLVALALADRGAAVGLITGDTWLSIKSFEALRGHLLRATRLETLIHMHDVSNHPDIFGANTAFTITAGGTAPARTLFVFLDDLSVDKKVQKLSIAIADHSSDWRFALDASVFRKLPGEVIAYRLTANLRDAFLTNPLLGDRLSAMNGMTTGENAKFLRLWFEVSESKTNLNAADAREGNASGAKWFPYNKGGGYRKWAGNYEYVINWEADGRDVIGNGRAFTRGRKNYFRPMVSWGKVSSGAPSFRYYPEGFLFDVAGTAMFGDSEDLLLEVLSFCNSAVAQEYLSALSPTLNYESGQISSLPLVSGEAQRRVEIARRLVEIARADWEGDETSWGFVLPQLLSPERDAKLQTTVENVQKLNGELVVEALSLERENNSLVAAAYNTGAPELLEVATDRIALRVNPEYRFGAARPSDSYNELIKATMASDLISYAVGCMFGRYSLDAPGLILANAGDTLQDFLAKVPSPSWRPDEDNVIPIVDGAWFEDDIVARFRQFLRVAFGEAHFEENVRFVTASLGVKDLRDYFVKSFYKDHVQRYKKRPIYWLFSSPRGTFNALIYLHRYTASSVSTVLNEYLREFIKKLEVSLEQEEYIVTSAPGAREAAAAQKEADRLRKGLVELRDYERDLYALASRQILLDLDDGVLVNYQKFGPALKDIGLKKGGDDA